jgi:hypothetical protein
MRRWVVVFAARGTIFNFANRPPRLARRLHGPRRRQSSPSHNAWPENRSTAVAGRCGISPRLLPHVTASLEPYSHAAVARMIDEANGSAAGLHRPLASVASKSAGRVSRGCQLTPDRGPILARHNMAMAEELEMSDWKFFYQDENGRDAQSTHSSRETTIVQALQLARRCHIEKIEGPNGERIDNERFEREHLKRPSGHTRPSDPWMPRAYGYQGESGTARRSWRLLSPNEKQADVARHPVGKVNNSRRKMETLRLQIMAPSQIDLGGFATQRRRPARVGYVNSTAAVAAHLARKAH